MMQFQNFVEWAFLGVVSGGVYVLWRIHDSLNELNVKVAVVISQMESHERRISDLEDREK
jgi:hypothetical protein